MLNSNSSYSGLVQKYIGTAYDNVKIVADNIDAVIALAGIEDLDDIAAIIAHTTDPANPHSTSDQNLVVTDVTDNDVSIAAHGFVPKGTDAGEFLKDDGTWDSIDPTITTNANVAANTAHRIEAEQYINFFNGSFVESFDATVASDGATITMSLAQTGGGDLTMRFNDGDTILDCDPTPQTIALTAGSDINPQANYIYILQSTKVLTKSPTAWPSAEHIKIGFFFVQSEAFVQTAGRGALINQNWNDHVQGTDLQGHMTHMAEVIRMGTGWFSGVAGASTTGDDYMEIIINGGAADNVYFRSTAGIAYQAHRHVRDALNTGASDIIHVVNHNTTPYKVISDIADELTDAEGVTMADKYYNLVFAVMVNKPGEYSPILMNLPIGSYATEADATGDISDYDVTSFPREFLKESNTGIFVCRVTLRHQSTGSGTWTFHQTVDLRGGLEAGGGAVAGAGTSFNDSQFEITDNTDDTKIIKFEAGSISPATTRTYTLPDETGTITLDTHNHDAAYTAPADIVYALLDTNGDVGPAAGQLAIGDHLHATVYEPLKGANDNFVTDSQLSLISGLPDIAGNAATATDADTVDGVQAAALGQLGVAAEWTRQQNFAITSLGTSGAIAWNLNMNQVAIIALDGDATISLPTNIKNGATYILVIANTGAFEITAWNAVFKWSGGIVPVTTQGAGVVEILTFVAYNGNLHGVNSPAFS